MSNELSSHYYRNLAILVTLCFIVILSRAHTYYEPLERDITIYAVIAHEMLAGQELYSDLWDIKPPAIYVTFAISEFIVGYGLQSIYLLNVLAAIISLLGVYAAGNAVSSQRNNAGLWAAGCWTILSGDLYLQANQPNVEVFINACLIWAFALFLRMDNTKGYRNILLIGILFAIASLYKQVTIVAAMGFAGVYLLSPPSTITRKTALFHVFIIAGVGFISWCLVFGYFSIMGRFTAFYETVFLWNQFYAKDIFANLLEGLEPWFISPAFSFVTLIPILLLFIGLAIGLYRKQRVWLFLLAYTLVVPGMVALPGKFFPHYYQLWLPLLCVATGWTIVELTHRISIRFKEYIEMSAGFMIILLLLVIQLPSYMLSPDEWSRKKYGDIFILSEALGQEINKILLPGETFYEWGGEAGLFFYSQRRLPTGVFLIFPLLEGPAVEKLSARAIADLQRNQPELVILQTMLYPINPKHPVIAWIFTHYTLFPHTNPRQPFHFLLRKGGRLANRK